MKRFFKPAAIMGPEEKDFFQRLGRRIAALRNERGLTQVQLAQILEISQQQVLSFEKGRRKVPVSILPQLSKALGVTIEELVGEPPETGRRGPTPKIQRQLEQVRRLPRTKQRFVSEMLDTILQQAGL